MNSTQRKFRKEMDNAKKQGKLPESYEARRFRTITFNEHKTGFSIAGLSLVGILVFCWNVFAVGTWVNSFSSGTSFLSSSSAIVFNNDQKVINEYLSNNKETQKYLSSSLQLVSDIYSKKSNYSLGTIKTQHDTLLSYKHTIETDKKYLKPIKEIYIKEFNIVDNALFFAEDNYGRKIYQSDIDYLRKLIEQDRGISLEKNNAYIELFKNAKMPYSISEDGTIKYQFKQ